MVSVTKYSDQALQLSYIFEKATTDVMKNLSWCDQYSFQKTVFMLLFKG